MSSIFNLQTPLGTLGRHWFVVAWPWWVLFWWLRHEQRRHTFPIPPWLSRQAPQPTAKKKRYNMEEFKGNQSLEASTFVAAWKQCKSLPKKTWCSKSHSLKSTNHDYDHNNPSFRCPWQCYMYINRYIHVIPKRMTCSALRPDVARTYQRLPSSMLSWNKDLLSEKSTLLGFNKK